MSNNFIKKGLVSIIITALILLSFSTAITGRYIDTKDKIISDDNRLIDIIVTLQDSDDAINVKLGDGLGGFGADCIYSVGNQPTDILTGDFNNDYFVDVAVLNFYGKSICVFLGDGNGGLGVPQEHYIGLTPEFMEAGDFNNDGYLDIIVTISVLKEEDFIRILFGDGTGQFSSHTDLTVCDETQGPKGIVIDDFNYDNNADFAVALQDRNEVLVFIGDGTGSFATPVDYPVSDGPTGIISGDFDDDGYVDLAVSSEIGLMVTILTGYGNGRFGGFIESFSPKSSYDMVSGDFNHDDILDIAMNTYYEHVVTLHTGFGDGTFFQDFPPVRLGPKGITTDDFNNDGNLDLAVTGYNDDNISLLYGTGESNRPFEENVSLPIGRAPYGIVADGLRVQPPYVPKKPIPDNSEVNVGISPILKWVGGDPNSCDTVLYDVFFGESITPLKFSSNQSKTVFNPGVLDFDTTYYWKIVAWDSLGYTAESPVWSFTTRPNTAPSNPSINGEVEGKFGVQYNYTLKSEDAESDEVYYFVEWGDRTVEEWIGPYSSGENVTVGHIWEERGEYTIRVKAKDNFDAESDWTTLEVSMPLKRMMFRSLFDLFIHGFIHYFPLLENILSYI